ncbi:pyridine nucleotide-disulfide oxidoreductase [Massilia eurypsychrophila]|uniref:Pyridine nucleotide-disulfide oxidoreductase n=1 Tax=Massilia eurypsychrophila TaxID=1485217 RepID=A0A2G8THY6_9BURK|nr:FAD-dependent oxidoreductase [Massilia eurypsychrophila]PIL45656.1 pyridine nucleotide-disulfide oxidoreductase [Massilia eurypsychrophila]
MKRLLLVGAGHSHAKVLFELAGDKAGDIAVTLVSPEPLAPYSGMVPGWMAGHYRWEQCCVDFARLCRRAGATLRIDRATGIDLAASRLQLASGASLPYDVLSLDIGSTSTPPGAASARLLPTRPLAALRERWEVLRATVSSLPADVTFRVVMIGGGAAGTESVLAVRHQLAKWAPRVAFDYVLATQGSALLAQLAAGAGRRIAAQLQQHGVRVLHDFAAERIDDAGVWSRDGRMLDADVVLWAAGPRAHGWPAASGLAHDDGFVRVDGTLRSVSHPNIFAAGDCASFEKPLPKAGVFAVRMGPVLSHNLRAALRAGALQTFTPQRRHLVLLGTGDAHAVAAWGPFSCQGKWVWRWKQALDRTFINRYNRAPEHSA